MTTRVRKEMALDLSRNPSWPVFSARPSAVVPSATLAAYTLTWKGRADDAATLLHESARELERHLARAIQRLGLVMQVLLVHQTLQPRSASVLFRRLWRSVSVPAPPPRVGRGPELQIDCEDRLRFAALASIPADAIQWMLAAMDSFEVVVPVLLRAALPLDEVSTRALASAGLPPDGCFVGSSLEWPGLVARVCEMGGIAVRRTRNLADAELAVDFFGSEADVESLARSMEDGHDVA